VARSCPTLGITMNKLGLSLGASVVDDTLECNEPKNQKLTNQSRVFILALILIDS